MPPEKVSADLKWSLWSADLEHWKSYAPDAHALLWAHPEHLVIFTAPRKECRYGEVTIECNGDINTVSQVRAYGHFECEWDDMPDLANALSDEEDLADDVIERRVEMLSDYFLNGGGPASVVFDVSAPTLVEALALVDAQEDDLLRQDAEAWTATEEWAKEMFK